MYYKNIRGTCNTHKLTCVFILFTLFIAAELADLCWGMFVHKSNKTYEHLLYVTISELRFDVGVINTKCNNNIIFRGSIKNKLHVKGLTKQEGVLTQIGEYGMCSLGKRTKTKIK